MPKLPVPEALVTQSGVFGDSHTNGRHHGGPARAVSLFSIERIRALQAEGHPIGTGTTGENLTVIGLDWDLVVPGSLLEAGEAMLEVTTYTRPCRTIRDSFTDGKFLRLSQTHHPGWSRIYTRVIREGMIRTGDEVILSPASLPQKGWLESLLT
ncbi:MAG: MOSC domain-containing protein [Gemmatimonadaceae bacterium]